MELTAKAAADPVSKAKGEGKSTAGSQSNNKVCFVDLGIPEVEKIFAAWKFGPLQTDSFPRTTIFPEENNVVKKDRISKLPNDILEFIIFLLPMREGAITCVLSRRWRYLWKTSASCLDFSTSTIFGDHYPRGIFKDKSTNLLYKKGRVFSRRVNTLMKFRSAFRLEALRIFFPLGNESASHIDRWLKSAVSQRITELNLDFNFHYFGLRYDSSKAYKFPTHIFTQNCGASLKYLSLNFCIFNFPSNFKGFNSLVSLNIGNTHLTNSDVANILSNCSSLESLSLHVIIDSRKLIFSSPSSPVLKHISYHVCGPSEVGIHDINILSFEVNFHAPGSVLLSIKNVPNLIRLHLFVADCVEIMCDIPPRLEMLLFMGCWKNGWFKLFELDNLKQLLIHVEVRRTITNIPNVIYALEACPLLQKLELNIGFSIESVESLENIKAMPRVSHYSLKEVNIYGFESQSTIIEFAKYLLKNAIMLERMKIYTKRKQSLSNGLWRHCEKIQESEIKEGEGISIVEVYALLQKEVCSPVEILICSDE